MHYFQPIEMPICASWQIFCCPNVDILLQSPISWSFFRLDILNIADGLALEIWPKSCQFGGAFGSGQLKYTINQKTQIK